jgi:hypothetical protein
MLARLFACVVFAVSTATAAAYSACAWADAPLIAAARIEPGSGFQNRNATITRWLRGTGPERVKLAWIGPSVKPGEAILYAHRMERGTLQSVAVRPTARWTDDLRLIELLKHERNIVRGRFVINSGIKADWRNVFVQLSSGRSLITAQLDQNGEFERSGVLPGVYSAVLLRQPSMRVRARTSLRVAVPEHGCAEPVFVVERYTLRDEAQEKLTSATSYVRALGQVVMESFGRSRHR